MIDTCACAGEVVAKQVPQKEARQDQVQQPKATKNWGRIVGSKLGEVQLPRATENWGHVMRSKLNQTPVRHETITQGELPVDAYACMVEAMRGLPRPRVC